MIYLKNKPNKKTHPTVRNPTFWEVNPVQTLFNVLNFFKTVASKCLALLQSKTLPLFISFQIARQLYPLSKRLDVEDLM